MRATYSGRMSAEVSSNIRKRFLGVVLLAGLMAGLSFADVPAPATAAGTPSGPKYKYKMISVKKSASHVRGAKISSEVCAPTGNATTASYTTSTTRSNTFNVTGDLGFSVLKGLLSSKVSVSGGVTMSTTTTEGLTTNVPAKRCLAVFELRDKYSYTLQKKCQYACLTKKWTTVGKGTYSKFIGRAYFYTK